MDLSGRSSPSKFPSRCGHHLSGMCAGRTKPSQCYTMQAQTVPQALHHRVGIGKSFLCALCYDREPCLHRAEGRAGRAGWTKALPLGLERMFHASAGDLAGGSSRTKTFHLLLIVEFVLPVPRRKHMSRCRGNSHRSHWPTTASVMSAFSPKYCERKKAWLGAPGT
jgi:hypothetical protein